VLRALVIVGASIKTLRAGEPPDGEPVGEGLRSAGKALEVLGEAGISPTPRESARDPPAKGRPTMPLMSSLLDDLHPQHRHARTLNISLAA
jgi:hypothetical protein